MFDFIRTHQRLMQLLLLLLIFPSFVFLGVESYSRFMGKSDDVAEVDGQRLSKQMFEQAYRDQLERSRQMMGASFDAAFFDKPEVKQAVLEGLIKQNVVIAAANKANLAVSDKYLVESIQTIPAVQGLKKPDGTFDLDAFKAMLAGQGQTIEQFEVGVRRELILQQVSSTVGMTALQAKQIGNALARLNQLEYETRAMQFPMTDYLTKVSVDQSAIDKEYESNKMAYMTKESVNAQYVVLSLDSIAASLTVNEEALKEYYENNKSRYQADEERRASHILLSVKEGGTDKDWADAKAKADAVFSKLQKNPGEYEALAKKESQDTGSASKGGDLGVIIKGSIGGPTFDEMTFKLNENQIGEPIKTQFGYHIIKVTSIKPAAIKKFDEVRPSIEREVKKQLASQKYAEAAETFSNTVYEQSDSLEPVATKLGLKIESTSNLHRQPDASTALPYLKNDKVLKALFTDEVAKNKRNSEAIEVAPNTLLAVHVTDYSPSVARPLSEVTVQIKQKLLEQAAVDAAAKAGTVKLEELKATDNVAGFSEVKKLTRANATELGKLASERLFSTNVDKLPAYVGVDEPGKGYVIYRIGKISLPEKLDPATVKSAASTYNREQAQAENEAYLRLLSERAKVQKLQEFKAEKAAS
ncbi:SurA N-terminal domain-containing protein [Ampullimonas aquatilis]|uniref:SurA N-terminal domain-containing protein n=1 Tax=Ampullimonas aquatilis TaxID=1341549 RepID=UPI003C779943